MLDATPVADLQVQEDIDVEIHGKAPAHEATHSLSDSRDFVWMGYKGTV